jgi:hypothetical protein
VRWSAVAAEAFLVLWCCKREWRAWVSVCSGAGLDQALAASVKQSSEPSAGGEGKKSGGAQKQDKKKDKTGPLGKRKKLCHLWFHTGYVRDCFLAFSRGVVDKASKVREAKPLLLWRACACCHRRPVWRVCSTACCCHCALCRVAPVVQDKKGIFAPSFQVEVHFEPVLGEASPALPELAKKKKKKKGADGEQIEWRSLMGEDDDDDGEDDDDDDDMIEDYDSSDEEDDDEDDHGGGELDGDDDEGDDDGHAAASSGAAGTAFAAASSATPHPPSMEPSS